MHQTNMDWFGGLRAYRWNRLLHNREYFDRQQQSWALNYAHRGQLRLAIDGGEPIILQAPVAYWTWPGPRWTYGPVGEHDWEHVFVSWLGERPAAWVRSGLFPSQCMKRSWMTITDPDRFSRSFDQLHRLLDEGESNDPAVVHASEGLLLQLHQQPTMLPASSLGEGVRRRLTAMREEPGGDWDFAWEAKRLGCTLAHLRRLWKQRTGLPPQAWLQKIRLDQAAQRLRTTEHPLQHIAEEVGYDNPSLFSRLFRKAKGMPPGQYRRAYRDVD